MDQAERGRERAERLAELTQSARHTPMGKLLRRFWQPITVAEKLPTGTARLIRVMGEDLTLYRGESGTPYLVADRCAHRLTLLHTGWVQGEHIRCMYHGWQYDGSGQCVQRPAEDDDGPPHVRIASYPLHEYAGLIFAYMGEGAPPEFDLPRKDVFEAPDRLIIARQQIWPCNWFQQVENSLDAAHVSFVHLLGRVGPFGEAVTARIPKLDYAETEAGIRQTAYRGNGNVRISDWTFPNNNHVVVPALSKDEPWIDLGIWMVPIDETRTMRLQTYAIPVKDEVSAERFRTHFAEYGNYNPADHHESLFNEAAYPEEPLLQLTPAQDYVAQMGQGACADRAHELLGKSDAGVVLLRRLFWREMEAVRNGGSPKTWRRLANAVELPRQRAVDA